MSERNDQIAQEMGLGFLKPQEETQQPAQQQENADAQENQENAATEGLPEDVQQPGQEQQEQQAETPGEDQAQVNQDNKEAKAEGAEDESGVKGSEEFIAGTEQLADLQAAQGDQSSSQAPIDAVGNNALNWEKLSQTLGTEINSEQSLLEALEKRRTPKIADWLSDDLNARLIEAQNQGLISPDEVMSMQFGEDNIHIPAHYSPEQKEQLIRHFAAQDQLELYRRNNMELSVEQAQQNAAALELDEVMRKADAYINRKKQERKDVVDGVLQAQQKYLQNQQAQEHKRLQAQQEFQAKIDKAISSVGENIPGTHTKWTPEMLNGVKQAFTDPSFFYKTLVGDGSPEAIAQGIARVAFAFNPQQISKDYQNAIASKATRDLVERSKGIADGSGVSVDKATNSQQKADAIRQGLSDFFGQ